MRNSMNRKPQALRHNPFQNQRISSFEDNSLRGEDD
jgi:hypothetical protein